MAEQDDDGRWWIGAHVFMASDTFNVYYHTVSDTNGSNGREKLVDMRDRGLTLSCYLISCSPAGLQGHCQGRFQGRAVVVFRLACSTVTVR